MTNYFNHKNMDFFPLLLLLTADGMSFPAAPSVPMTTYPPVVGSDAGPRGSPSPGKVNG